MLVRLGKLLFALLLILIFTITGFIAWVTIEPRDVTYFANFIINKLHKDYSSPQTLKLEKVTLQWSSEKHKLNAKILNASLNLTDEVYIKTNQLDLYWEITPLVLGLFKHVEINIDQIAWHSKNGVSVVDFKTQLYHVNQHAIKYFQQLNKASISFTNLPIPMGKINKITFKPSAKHHKLFLQANSNLNLAGHHLDLNMLIDLSKVNYIYIKTHFNGKTPKNALFNGDLNFIMPEWQQIKDGKFSLQLKNTNVSGALVFDGQILKSNLLFENPMPIENLWQYWPPYLLEKTQTWLNQHLTQGIIKAASIKTEININEVIKNKRLQKDEIKADILIDQAELAYLTNVPTINNSTVGLKINGDELSIDMYQGKLGNLKLKGTKGNIKFTSNPEEEGIAVNATISGELQESIDIAYKHINKENTLFNNLSGNAITNLAIFIPFRDDIDIKNLNIKTNSKISEANVPNLMEKYNLSKGNFNLALSGSDFKLSGTTTYKNILPLSIFVRLPNISNPDQELILSLSSEDYIKNFRSLGVTIPSFIDNKLRANLILVKKKNIWFKNLTLDFTDSQILLNEIGVDKKIGEKAHLNITFLPDINESWKTNSYKLDFPHTKSTGKIEISPNFDSITQLTSEELVHNKAKLNLAYNKFNRKNEITINGEYLDLSNINWLDLKESAGYSGEETIIKGNIENLKMKNDITLISPIFEIRCVKQKCHNVNLASEIKDGGFVKIETDENFVFIKSNNAGRSLAAFDISNNIIGGSIDISGEFDEQNRFNGHAYMQMFSLRKTSVFTKLLMLPVVTATSIFNISELFDGSKMSFDMLHCPIHYARGKILLQHCTQENKNLLIKGSGYIDLDRNTIDSQGVIAPKSVINKIVSAIPLIGKTLSGRNKEGILAISYSLSGPLRNPRMNVNPLSVLTPGITKEVFNIGKKKERE
jgi:hypothetical protein